MKTQGELCQNEMKSDRQRMSKIIIKLLKEG